MIYQPHEQRVIDEKSELDAKLPKLREFTATETFAGLDPADQRLLQSQALAMDGYSSILRRRIDRFTPTATASTHGLLSSEGFPLGKACDLSGEGGCDACQ